MLTSKQVAEGLHHIGALQVRPESPFTWTSGLLSPIYCDNRLVMSDVELRNQIAKTLAAKIEAQYGDVDVVAGCATAGIPHAAWVADELQLPMVYVRDKAKGHGKHNQIEGKVQPGQKVVVLEDLISTGKSSIAAAHALRAAGANVLGVVAVFSYDLQKARTAFQEAFIEYKALTTFQDLLSFMKEKGHLTEEMYNDLSVWNEDPETFSSNYQLS